jgi:hypothetical protein
VRFDVSRIDHLRVRRSPVSSELPEQVSQIPRRAQMTVAENLFRSDQIAADCDDLLGGFFAAPRIRARRSKSSFAVLDGSAL